jgi:hypothetical protein
MQGINVEYINFLIFQPQENKQKAILNPGNQSSAKIQHG